MKKNLGTTDKVIRLLIAAVIAGLYFTQVISGLSGIILGILSLILILTSFISFCPLYLPFGINTNKSRRS